MLSLCFTGMLPKQIHQYSNSLFSACTFRKVKDKSEGTYSGCKNLGVSSGHHSIQLCIDDTSAVGGNVFNWDGDNHCYYRKCESVNDLQLKYESSWNVYACQREQPDLLF